MTDYSELHIECERLLKETYAAILRQDWTDAWSNSQALEYMSRRLKMAVGSAVDQKWRRIQDDYEYTQATEDKH